MALVSKSEYVYDTLSVFHVANMSGNANGDANVNAKGSANSHGQCIAAGNANKYKFQRTAPSFYPAR